jgi:hypothetical protein
MGWLLLLFLDMKSYLHEGDLPEPFPWLLGLKENATEFPAVLEHLCNLNSAQEGVLDICLQG